MEKINILKKLGYFALVIFLVATAALVVANKFGVGGMRILVVSSGSMEPSIGKSSVVLTVPGPSYDKGDVITFKKDGREDILVTHRVVGLNEAEGIREYTTKGDANEEADAEAVVAKNVVGSVIVSIPQIGRLISFAQTQVGFMTLIVIPAVAIIYSEIISIKNQISMYFAKKREKKLIKPLEI